MRVKFIQFQVTQVATKSHPNTAYRPNMAYCPKMAYCPNMAYHPIKYNSDTVATNMDCQTITGSNQKQVEGQREQWAG